MSKIFKEISTDMDVRSRTEVGTERDIRTDSYELEAKDFSGGYELESQDVIGQDMEELSSSTDSLLELPYPPLEIADYLSHYIPPA